jgi:SAM-dependent methyltransferase
MSETIVTAPARAALHSAAPIACPACRAQSVSIFCSMKDVPANSCILLSSAEEARSYPTGDIDLGFCGDCGFIFNASFDETKAKYSDRYEETQGFSTVFNKFHQKLAERIVEKHDLHGKKIVEIGCGKGEFLVLLAQIGNNHGVGIDPGVHLDRIPKDVLERLTFIQDFYAEEHITEDVDFVACKMTLEHIPSALAFIEKVYGGVKNRPDATVFFQIPDAMRVMRECAFEDIYYEHCSYFSPGSLARLFRRAGFSILDVSSEYDGQYLTIEARASTDDESATIFPEESDLDELRVLVERFPARWREMCDTWRGRLDGFHREGKTIALWGSGSKAVSFITTLELGEQVSAVTDINPYRHGHYLPKSAHPIVSPNELAAMKPDVVIAMNRIYRDEIAKDLQALGIECELLAL